MSLTIKDGKILSIGKLSVTVLKVPTTPTEPTEPTDPTDPLSVKVAALVAAAPTEDRNAVSELFRSTGNLKLEEPKQIRTATKLLFDLLPLAEGWESWKESVDEYAGSLNAADIKRAWLLIAEGLK